MDQDVEKASSHTAGIDSSPRPSIERSRSNNGYGVSDAHGSSSGPSAQNSASAAGEKDSDYIEVGWDGDSDPLYPRNYAKARKWLITCLVSFGSFTVYVTYLQKGISDSI